VAETKLHNLGLLSKEFNAYFPKERSVGQQGKRELCVLKQAELLSKNAGMSSIGMSHE
jgi:hypothetical protein